IACRACYTSYPGPAPIFPVMTGACSFFIHRLPKALKRCHAFTARADSTPASIDLIGLHSGDVFLLARDTNAGVSFTFNHGVCTFLHDVVVRAPLVSPALTGLVCGGSSIHHKVVYT